MQSESGAALPVASAPVAQASPEALERGFCLNEDLSNAMANVEFNIALKKQPPAKRVVVSYVKQPSMMALSRRHSALSTRSSTAGGRRPSQSLDSALSRLGSGGGGLGRRRSIVPFDELVESYVSREQSWLGGRARRVPKQRAWRYEFVGPVPACCWKDTLEPPPQKTRGFRFARPPSAPPSRKTAHPASPPQHQPPPQPRPRQAAPEKPPPGFRPTTVEAPPLSRPQTAPAKRQRPKTATPTMMGTNKRPLSVRTPAPGSPVAVGVVSPPSQRSRPRSAKPMTCSAGREGVWVYHANLREAEVTTQEGPRSQRRYNIGASLLEHQQRQRGWGAGTYPPSHRPLVPVIDPLPDRCVRADGGGADDLLHIPFAL
ncbi:unnamed protein product [Vitrella brassicaformis CCMP3155]|uniref:Uncharacterized protein n=1 Tax=Vitrella brassicaformis (strain CCMP3155) TaxID=1169540 RepID=A0A0G4E9Y6_VITBC|nr:unnamed protein product [Vitrella brassicaformis CCMP3155]|eukprot:CEL92005.1 unnamed protein product [Vitrella brassicaformis CCMP3155]